MYKRRVRDLELELRQAKSADKSSPNTKKAAKTPGTTQKNNTQALGSTNVRVLSLKQLKDMIADMYSNKVKFDKKCEDAHLARETME